LLLHISWVLYACCILVQQTALQEHQSRVFCKTLLGNTPYQCDTTVYSKYVCFLYPFLWVLQASLKILLFRNKIILKSVYSLYNRIYLFICKLISEVIIYISHDKYLHFWHIEIQPWIKTFYHEENVDGLGTFHVWKTALRV
jgi:hypothetical protein